MINIPKDTIPRQQMALRNLRIQYETFHQKDIKEEARILFCERLKALKVLRDLNPIKLP